MYSLHPGLTKNLSQDIERVQRRCLKLLYPALSYNQALNKSDIDRLDSRRYVITQKMFQEIKDQKTSPCIICCHLLNCLIVKCFYGPHTHYH